MASPPTIGLTGAIAAGKSTALEILGELGAETISADAVVHELLDREPLVSRIRERWGEAVFGDAGVDRTRVGEIVFADDHELSWLENELHPLVGERIGSWAAGLGPDRRAAVAEIPLLFEGEMESSFDTTVAVVSRDAIRRERAALRGHALSEERESLQLPQEQKAARADRVIVNDGTREELKAALAELLDELAPVGL